MGRFIFVDCEATGPCPGKGLLTEFGAVDYDSRETFNGILYESEPDPANPARSRVLYPGAPCPCMTCSGHCACYIVGHHED